MTRINWVMPPPSITYRECVRDVVARPCTFLFILIVLLSIFCFERFSFFFMSVSSPRIKRGNFIFEKLMWRGSPASRNGARDLNFLLLAYTGVQCSICIYRNPLWRLILHLLSSSLLKTTFSPDQGETFAPAYMLCVWAWVRRRDAHESLSLFMSLCFFTDVTWARIRFFCFPDDSFCLFSASPLSLCAGCLLLFLSPLLSSCKKGIDAGWLADGR